MSKSASFTVFFLANWLDQFMITWVPSRAFMDKSKDHSDSARRVVIIFFSQRHRWLGKKRRVFNRSRTYSLLAQPPPQALRFSQGRGERETRVTGDEPQGTMGRVQTASDSRPSWKQDLPDVSPVVSFPPSFARTFSSKERRLGTRQLLAPVVQTVDSAIHWIIHHYPVDNGTGFRPT